jgi:hypothetical protein
MIQKTSSGCFMFSDSYEFDPNSNAVEEWFLTIRFAFNSEQNRKSLSENHIGAPSFK